MKKIEIYWHDLTEKAQMDILELLGEKEESHNWDTFPMAVVEIKDPDDIDILSFIVVHYEKHLAFAKNTLFLILQEFPAVLIRQDNWGRTTAGDILRFLDHKTDNELLSVPGIGKARLKFLRKLQVDIRRAL